MGHRKLLTIVTLAGASLPVALPAQADDDVAPAAREGMRRLSGRSIRSAGCESFHPHRYRL